jgi:CRP-like cAMP-binding protein
MDRSLLTQFIYQSNQVPFAAANTIAALFTAGTIAKNDFLVKSGQVPNVYLFLEQGYMRGFARDAAGNEVTTAFYAPGQMVFEVASFFTSSRSKENIQALTDCEGRFITLAQLNELFHSMPEFREFGRSMLIKEFSELKSRMLSTITETAEERYLQLMLSQPLLFQHASLKHIASFLGITDTSLSRIRAAVSKK